MSDKWILHFGARAADPCCVDWEVECARGSMAAILRSRRLQYSVPTSLGIGYFASGSLALGVLDRGWWSDSGSGLLASLLGCALGFGVVGAFGEGSKAEVRVREEGVEHEGWEEFKAWISGAGGDLKGVELCRSEVREVWGT